jgi:hypothetical protein
MDGAMTSLLLDRQPDMGKVAGCYASPAVGEDGVLYDVNLPPFFFLVSYHYIH